jgi:ABC-type branched-subunit amino acid transport system ATPase component/branched-subunit amino acid ABC-type transport system permease component
MNDLLGYALLSLGTGALYALAAAGVIVLQRGAGVLNLAQGAMLGASAYVFGWARYDAGWPTPVAAVATVALAAGTGLAFHLAVMRPLRDATSLTRLMATLGLLVILTSLVSLLWGQGIRYSPAVLPTGKVALAGQHVGVDVFVRLAVVAAVVAGLWAAFRFSTVGLATTAVTENPRAAAAFGWSPDVIAGGAWALGSGLAGLGGVLLAPLDNPLDAGTLVLLAVPALAVALVARFRSLPGALAGGLALGLAEVETQVQLITPHRGWRGLDQAIPLAVIVIYLVARGRGIPERGHVAERQPELGSGQVHWPALGVLLAGTLTLVWVVLPDDWVSAINANALWALIILSVVVLVGFTGQLSLGQVAFSGIAALIAGRLVAIARWPAEAALAVGVAGTAAVGVLFALPALRTRGLQLAVVTLGLGAAVDALLFQRGYHSPAPRTGVSALFADLGSPGGTIVGNPSFLGVRLNKITDPRGFATLSIAAFTLVALGVANLRRGRAGRRLIAVRTNERAAASLGVSIVGAKLYAFGLSAAIAGLGGVLYAFYLYGDVHNIDYGGGEFSPFNSILLVAYAVVGGVGWVSGTFAGAGLAAGALGARIGRLVSDLLGGLTWLIRLLAAAAAGHAGHRLGRDIAAGRRGAAPRARRALPWLGAAAGMAVAVVFGTRIIHWLTHLDRYTPLVGGVILLSVLTRSGGGAAPEYARATRDALAARRPGPAARRQARVEKRAAALVGGTGAAAAGVAGARARQGPALTVSGLTVRFGAVTAVEGLSLRVAPGQIVGLIGPNGAGKSTVVDAVTGYARAAAGSVTLGGRALDGLAPHRRARAGVTRSFQNLELFAELTVLENIQAASDPRDLRAYLTNPLIPRARPLPPAAVAAIEAFGLAGDLTRPAGELPYGRRRLLAIARAVATVPSVLLLDEPCAGLSEEQSAEVAGLVRRLADDWGLAILLNEHDMDVVRRICDHVIVLDGGRMIAEGPPAGVLRDERVRAAYLGEQPTGGRPGPGEQPALAGLPPAMPGEPNSRLASSGWAP